MFFFACYYLAGLRSQLFWLALGQQQQVLAVGINKQ
jgi:hypothetical protein